MERPTPPARTPAWPFVLMLALALAAFAIGLGERGELAVADRDLGLLLFLGGAAVTGSALAALVLAAARRGTLFDRGLARSGRSRYTSASLALALGGVALILLRTVGSGALGELLLLGCASGGLLGLALALLRAVRSRAAG